MIFRPFLIPIAKWIKQLAQLLHGLLSFIVFTALDFMDSVFCIVFAYLDEFFKGNNYVSAPCYCLKKRRMNEDGDDDNGERESQLSETLYGDCRRNVFRELGLRRRFEESKEKRVGFGSELGKREKGNRWSDCSCQSCVCWMKDGSDPRLHVVVQAPESPQARDGNLEGKSIENVVFLHGFISSSSFWTETVFRNLSEEAKQKYRLFAVDLFGFGRSPKPPGCLYTLKDHVEMIEKSVIFPFELNSFHLVAVKFLYQLGYQQRAMYTNLNEVPIQNQLAMVGVTHKLIYMLKPFNFINVGEHPLSYFFVFYQCGTIPTFILQHTPWDQQLHWLWPQSAQRL